MVESLFYQICTIFPQTPSMETELSKVKHLLDMSGLGLVGHGLPGHGLLRVWSACAWPAWVWPAWS